MSSPTRSSSGFLSLSLASIGVVYGDIGTSPLYTLKEVFNGAHAVPVTRGNVFGILSLIFWSLTIVISVKYVTFIMRADNHGEGGIMALTALALNRRHRRAQRAWIMGLGLFGTALFYGDGLITPAISVLSAVEGLEVGTPILHPYVLPIAIGVLLALFAIQSKGTAKVGAWFGPAMLLWFATLGYWGMQSIQQTPEIVGALHPVHALEFFAHHRWHGFIVLGAVVLAITGGEALYADMGHFGRNPIRLSWFVLVWPALMINYLGQGALILRDPSAIQNPFYLIAPSWALYPMIALATVATVIASQAVISGAFSITRQAVQLDYLPRQKMVHTSEAEIGQIFVPAVNRMLLFGVIGLVLYFGTSSNLAAAYGIAVTGAMAIDTLLASIVAMDSWKWKPLAATLLFGSLVTVDLAFFSANVPKIPDGGWFPLLLGTGLFFMMWIWRKGRDVLATRLQAMGESLKYFLESFPGRNVRRVPGTAVYLTARHVSLPIVLTRNLEHNKVLHERIVLLTMLTEDVPRISDEECLMIETLEQGFYRVTARFGFMQSPRVPRILRLCGEAGLEIDPETSSFFIGRETLIPSKRTDLNRWEETVFITLFRNASSPIPFFRLPVERVMELGTVVEV
ncbi:MAG TPA: potassium transporter Kup [Methylococcaceae bacterium]|nr:potassium transporter Kup [Methylococcaceae bacterium]